MQAVTSLGPVLVVPATLPASQSQMTSINEGKAQGTLTRCAPTVITVAHPRPPPHYSLIQASSVSASQAI
jgi:hypothetical protein